MIEEGGPEHSGEGPSAILVHLPTSLNKKATLLPEMSLNPQILVDQAGNWADVRQREAGDRRQWIFISSVSILAGMFT